MKTNRTVCMLACVLFGAPLWGQTLDWNRRLDAVAVVPRTTAGDNFFDVFVEWSLNGDNALASSAPQDLSTDVRVLVNGTVLSVTSIPAQIDPLAGECFDCMGTCTDLSCGTANNGQDQLHCVHDITCEIGGLCDCEFDCVCKGTPTPCLPDCVPDLPIASVPLNNGDEIMVILFPSPGALPDADTSDDTRVVVVDKSVHWNRRLSNLQLVPTAGAGDSFFDVWVDVSEESSGIDYLIDLSATVEVQDAAGAVLASRLVEMRHSPTPCASNAVGACVQTGTCGTGGGGAVPYSLACTSACLPTGECDCTCGHGETVILPGIPVPPGGVTVVLRPAPGALPELPGFPDDEEQGQPGGCDSLADCADLDADGIRDSNCIWWECDSTATCQGTMIPFADMGGPFGQCPPDLTADNNDRNHALNCFADIDINGNPGSYPCEENAPMALNVDAGGAFGSCVPDGVCDGNDAFHALNAFSGSTTCSCAVGPEPAVGDPTVVGRAALRLESNRKVMAPGELVDIDVVLAQPLEDLRGYQLHLNAAGPGRGQLELVDISVHDDSVFDGAGPWQAFNLDSHQMVSGLDGVGLATDDDSYLATFTFRATRNAYGTHVIDLLVDHTDHTQRTYLFPTRSDGRIVVDAVEPAVITVISKKHR